jgi:hypothetical protein
VDKEAEHKKGKGGERINKKAAEDGKEAVYF